MGGMNEARVLHENEPLPAVNGYLGGSHPSEKGVTLRTV